MGPASNDRIGGWWEGRRLVCAATTYTLLRGGHPSPFHSYISLFSLSLFFYIPSALANMVDCTLEVPATSSALSLLRGWQRPHPFTFLSLSLLPCPSLLTPGLEFPKQRFCICETSCRKIFSHLVDNIHLDFESFTP